MKITEEVSATELPARLWGKGFKNCERLLEQCEARIIDVALEEWDFGCDDVTINDVNDLFWFEFDQLAYWCDVEYDAENDLLGDEE